MKDIEISENGVIYILGVTLGTDIEYAKKILSKHYDIEEGKTGIFISCPLFGFKNIKISYIKDNNNHISSIRIYYSKDSYRNIAFLCSNLDHCFSRLKKSEEVIVNGACRKINYQRSNKLQYVKFFLQDDPNLNALSVLIGSDLLNLNRLDLLQQSAYEVFTSKEENATININKMKSINIWNIIKTVLICIALFIAYLFALNGRYHFDGDEVIDKWNRTIGYNDYGSGYVDFP